MVVAWTTNTYAQSTGTTISLDGTTGKLLFSEGAGSDAAYSAFWKHNQAPIQLVMTNCAKGEVQAFNGTSNVFHGINAETGIFTTLPNNMAIESDEKLAIYNWATHYNCSYFAIIAPKGFRILRYIIDADVSGNSNTADVDFREFHLLEHETVIDDNVYSFQTTASGSSTVIDRVLDYSSSRLYFKVTFDSNSAHSFKFTSFKVIYAVDDAFSASVPNLVDGVATNQFGSGIINLGMFSTNSNSVWSFTSSNVSALSEVDVYDVSQKKDLGFAQVDGSPYYFTATNGDYIMEAPKQFRIVGAKVNFINVSTGSAFDGYVAGGAATPESGKQYLIKGADDKYISYINGALTSTDDARTAWTVTADGSGYTISIGGGSGSSVETGSINVTKNTGTLTANESSSYYYLWTGNEKAFTIADNGSANNINSTNSDGDLNFHAGSGTRTYNIAAPEGYVITGYSFDASQSSTGTVTISAGSNSLTVSTTAQSFSVSGLETSSTSFTVAGTNIPILFDNFKIDYKSTTGSESSSQTTTVTCEETTSRAATLFDNPETTSSTTNHYRIPAITKTADGNLLAISDLRIGASGDVGSNAISLVAKKSADNGATWGDESTIIAGNGTGFDYAHGDAAVVTDSETGKIILLAASGTTSYGNGGVLLGQYYSTDNGASWAGGEITDKIQSAFTAANLTV